MVLPIPTAAISVGASVPTSTVSSIKWIFIFGLILEFVLAGARFYILDIWGGVIMTLISVFGCFLFKYEFDLQWTVMFGITIFFYGLIHFVMLLERVIINWGDFPAPISEIKSLVKDIVFITAPIVDWSLMGICIFAFRKATTSYSGSSAAEREPLNGSGGSISNYSRTSSTFTPFAGQGRKLG